MPPAARCSRTTCPRCGGSCAAPRRATTGSRPWSRQWFEASSSGCDAFRRPLRPRAASRQSSRRRSHPARHTESEMHVFKKHVSRRTVLKGVGASIALPLLDAMNPAATAWAQTPAGAPPKRLAFIGFPHGAIMDRWSPAQTGANYEMSPILQPLEPFRQHLTIVSGLRNKPGESPEPHGYIEMTWLKIGRAHV